MALRTCLFSLLLVTPGVLNARPANLSLNDLEYFADDGVNLLVYSNWYDGLFSDAKISSVELIHHGERTATNGDVRLHATPEQWDPVPAFIKRDVDMENQRVEAFLEYADFDFQYSIAAEVVAGGLRISVNLEKPLPEALVGKAGFNFEFLPAAYFEKSYIMDDSTGLFPLYASGPKETDAVEAKPLATGNRLTLAPTDPARLVVIESANELQLYDGRSKAQNGWFVVRSEIPADKTGPVIEWTVRPNAIAGWTRPPNIAHSQVGYHPAQKKIAVIETDPKAKKRRKASLLKADNAGKLRSVADARPALWGRYQRYDYYTFDFSKIREPGIYQLEYDKVRTAPFRIDENVYETVWHPTLDIYLPVQMDHVMVNEAYRVWHGASHLDDALQAPVDHVHFDLYAQGPTTDTPFKPGEHIPGLNVGGWYDAGDYDIRTQTQYQTVMGLVDVWERFKPARDNMLVDYDRKFVDLHVPDGKPDLLQQIEHGTLQLLAQHKAVGRAIPGIVEAHLSQYTHLGDGMTKTDNLIYNADMDELESDGRYSGKFDDRWAFTSHSTPLNYGSVAGLAAASRALKGYNDTLAQESLDTALRAWKQERAQEPVIFKHGNTTGGSLEAEEIKAATELLIATGDSQYADRIHEYWPEIEKHFDRHAIPVLKALPHLGEDFKRKLQIVVAQYKQNQNEQLQDNPFGVRITEFGWAGNGAVMQQAIVNYYLHEHFPEIIDQEAVFRGLNYLFGTHPDSDISFVSGVGTQSKQVAYGMNRADFSFIAGGMVPGVLILKPDFPENKENWPFFWGQNEYVVNTAASYIFLSLAVNDLLTASQGDDNPAVE